MFQTKKTSPLPNIVLSSVDLRSDAQTKQKITAYTQGTDLTSTYTVQNPSHVQIISLKSSLSSWSMELPRTLTLRHLYTLAFRLTKGRYTKFELRHKNAALPYSYATLEAVVTSTIDVFVAPLGSTATPSANAKLSDMCLVKVYTSQDYTTPVCSYWESKSTTKTLATVVFRYY
jgi:hypothetical protein